MLRVIIDIGNTFVKIAAYDDDKCLQKETTSELTDEFLSLFLKKNLLNKPKAILSTVRNLTSEMLSLLQNKFQLLIFNDKTPIPITNHYKTPQTLGSDRLAAVIGATTLFPNNPILVFDAGSCLTWDFIDDQKNYWGGGIAPGIKMRLQSLHNFTEKLPLIETDFTTNLLGNNTTDAIKAGCVNATVLEIDAIIDDFKKRYNNLMVILCGGDVEIIKNKTKNNTFAHPNLVQVGLMKILDFNESK